MHSGNLQALQVSALSSCLLSPRTPNSTYSNAHWREATRLHLHWVSLSPLSPRDPSRSVASLIFPPSFPDRLRTPDSPRLRFHAYDFFLADATSASPAPMSSLVMSESTLPIEERRKPVNSNRPPLSWRTPTPTLPPTPPSPTLRFYRRGSLGGEARNRVEQIPPTKKMCVSLFIALPFPNRLRPMLDID